MIQAMITIDRVEVRDRERSHGKTIVVIDDLAMDIDGKVNGDHDDATGLIRITRSVHERLISALEKIQHEARDTLTGDEISAMKTLLHEVLHGCSPLVRKAYVGVATTIEEATNDIAARYYARRALGVAHPQLALPDGPARGFRARDVEIVRLRDALRSVVKLPMPTILQVLTDASLALKRSSAPAAETSDEFARMFVAAVQWPEVVYAGLSGEARTAQEIRYQDLLLEALGVPIIRTDANMPIKLPEIATLPRNDIPAALAFWRKHRKAGTLRDEEVSMLRRLQDDPEPLAAAMDAEVLAERAR
jgi:hypothetical protein